MSKTSKMYKIFMTAMIIAMAGMLIAAGVLAIKKNIKVKMGIDFYPGVNIEIFVKNDNNPAEKLIFRNFEDEATSKSIEYNKSYCSLSGNTLSMNNNFVTIYGENCTLIVYNYSNFPINVDMNSTASVEGVGDLSGTPATITPNSQIINACSSSTSPPRAEFAISQEVVMPQLTYLHISISEAPTATLKTGAEINTAIGTTATSVVFGYWNDYSSVVSETWEENKTNLSTDSDENASIKIFTLANDDTAKYILSKNPIMANEDSSTMFKSAKKIKIIVFDNFAASNIQNADQMFYMGSNAALTRIFVQDDWSMPNLQSSTNMFYQANSLYGEYGTAYKSSYTTNEYAVIDDSETPGYFSKLNSDANEVAPFMASYVENATSLTFDYWSADYQSKTGCDWEDGIDVSVALNGKIRAFADQNNATIFYVLSNDEIYTCSSMCNMFYNLKNLTTIDFINFNISNTTNMTRLFYGCTSLNDLDLSSLNTSNVANMSYMFYQCKTFTDLDVSKLNTSNTINMSRMFSGCSGLLELDLSTFDTSNVVDMSGMFASCTSLLELNISNFDTRKVSNMSEMFRSVSAIEELDISSFISNENGVIVSTATKNPNTFNNPPVMYGMFTGCLGLKTIYVDDGWDLSNFGYDVDGDGELELLSELKSDGYFVSVFYDCLSLTGANGTTCASIKSESSEIESYSATYARVDTAETPGYFTHINDREVTSYKVEFDANGGTGSMIRQVIESGVTTDLFLNKFTREQCKFQGWATTPSGGVVYTDGQSVTDIAQSGQTITLYANWKAVSYTIIFDSNNGSEETSDQIVDEDTNTNLDNNNFNNDGYDFEGWATSPDGDVVYTDKEIIYNLVSPGEAITLYAKWASTLANGSDVNSILGTDTISIVFGYWETYEYTFVNWDNGEADLSSGKKGTIKLFTNGSTKYVLSKAKIYVNSDASSMFSGFGNLTSITFNNFDTSNVTNMAAMFGGCNSLTVLNLSSFETCEEGVFLGGRMVNEPTTAMFGGCEKLTTIYVDPEKWNHEYVGGMNVFWGCKNLMGGNGTKYPVDNEGVYNGDAYGMQLNALYACIDGKGALTHDLATGNFAEYDGSGYFTDIAEKYV